MADKLDEINKNIKELENTESTMLARLQESINNHNKILRSTSRFSNQERHSAFFTADARPNNTASLKP